ncbi:FadR/GntR family transcriptional regulator [Thermodesulfobacteriota bacterium]
MKKGMEKIKKISTVDATANYLKKQVEEGALEPGEQLPSERTLQEILGVSRFTLREALARLSALGIIEIAHGKGAFVAKEMSPSSLDDVFLPLFANQSIKNLIDFFEARMLIESEAVRLCARRRKKSDLKALQTIIADSRAAMDDPVRFGEFDFLFHKEISKIAGNVFIDKMMGCLNEHIKMYLQVLASKPENRKRSLINHQNILEMIEKKDDENAGRVTREHLNRTFKLITRYNAKGNEVITKQDLTEIFKL